MSVEIACECDDLPAHTHIWTWGTDDAGVPNGERVMDEFDVRVWVNWKAVAREIA